MSRTIVFGGLRLVRTWSIQAPKNSLSATRVTVVSHSVPKRPGCLAGLFFGLRPRSHAPMDPDLENVIRQAFVDAQTAGRDHLSQTELAVRAVLQLVPLLASRLALGRPCPGLRIRKHDTTCR